MVQIEKALGNIKLSHKSITFTGLVNIHQNKAQFVHYLTNPVFGQIYHGPNADQSKSEDDNDNGQSGQTKITSSQMRKKVMQVLE